MSDNGAATRPKASPQAVLLDKIPPHNLEAEQSVLASCILDRTAIEECEALNLKPLDFYREAHQKLYTVIGDMAERGQPVDLVTLSDELRNRGILDVVGGLAYITLLLDTVPTSHNAEFYAKIVMEKAVLRRCIEGSQEVATLAYEGHTPAEKVVEKWQDLANGAINTKQQEAFTPIFEVAGDVLNSICDRADGKVAPATKTGFRRLDAITGGVERPSVWILASRPSVGKTSLAANIALNVACPTKQHRRVAFVSLEMPKKDVLLRFYAAMARMNLLALRTGELATPEMTKEQAKQRLSDAYLRFAYYPIDIADRRALGMSTVRRIGFHLRRHINKIQRETGEEVGLVILDYIQLLESDRPSSKLYEAMSRVAVELQQAVQDLEIPAILLAQMSRDVEKEKRAPMLSDLRDSGYFEQIGDVIAFLHRPDEPDLEDADPCAKLAMQEPYKVNLIIAKNRQGPVGVTIPLMFEGQYTQFVEIDEQQGDPGWGSSERRIGSY
jgi:replicative DNA helicase